MSCVVLAGGTQVVGMSATLSNISDLASFLKADTFSSQFRPVDLREYVKIGRTVYSVEVASGSCSVRLHPHRELTSGLQVLGSVGTQQHVSSLVYRY
jgi:superfamily II RNA helicase